MAIAMFSMLIFHPMNLSNPLLDVHNAIDRTYLSTLYSVNLGGIMVALSFNDVLLYKFWETTGAIIAML